MLKRGVHTGALGTGGRTATVGPSLRPLLTPTPTLHAVGCTAEYRSAAKPYERHPPHGVQFYAPAPKEDVVGQPYQHMAADLQVSGEAQYTDDIKHSPDVLHAALVASAKPHARLLSVDPSAVSSAA